MNLQLNAIKLFNGDVMNQNWLIDFSTERECIIIGIYESNEKATSLFEICGTCASTLVVQFDFLWEAIAV